MSQQVTPSNSKQPLVTVDELVCVRDTGTLLLGKFKSTALDEDKIGRQPIRFCEDGGGMVSLMERNNAPVSQTRESHIWSQRLGCLLLLLSYVGKDSSRTNGILRTLGRLSHDLNS